MDPGTSSVHRGSRVVLLGAPTIEQPLELLKEVKHCDNK